MPFPFYIIDTFTSEQFRGNPTGVGLLMEILDDDILMNLARELNFPVTAFIYKQKKVANHYTIRYFTNTTEIPACGHATLAASGIIFDLEGLEEITFETIDEMSLQVRKEGDLIVMSYPRFELEPFEIQGELVTDLGLSNYLSVGYSSDLETLFVEIDDPVLLKNIQPDYAALLDIREGIKEIIVTSKSDTPNYDFLLRSFCPWIGIDEDPVTGSVHAVLGGFWEERLQKKQLKAYQCSARGGELIVTSFEDKVELGGRMVTLFRGEMLV